MLNGWTGYWNGRFMPDDEIRVSPSDRGFVLGDAVYEITRTYRHTPFHLDWHLDRLMDGLCYIDLVSAIHRDEIETLTLEVLERNRAKLRAHDDVTLTQRITRGPNAPLFGGPPPGPPTVIITCRPIHFGLFAHLYTEGVELAVPKVRIPVRGGVDPRVKMQSRLAMALASVQVSGGGPHVLPLMVDVDGHITETSHTNVFAVFGGAVVTPPDEVALGGITRRVIEQVATAIGVEVIRRPISLSEVRRASEAFVTGTGAGPLPVRAIDGQRLRALPGPITARITDAFSKLVGVDIVAQARAHVAQGAAL